MIWRQCGCAVALLVFSGSAQAHSFGRLYTLPVPLWMYSWGASAALVLSFIMVAWFVSQHREDKPSYQRDLSNNYLGRRVLSRGCLLTLKALTVAALLLCIATGLFGTANAFLNFNMTFFWIVFVLGFSYFTAIFGGLYTAINPWQSIIQLLSRYLRLRFDGRIAAPHWLGCWPALGFYLAFIWIELFVAASPYTLAWLLIGYSIITVAGAWLLGTGIWFTQVEFFSVFFRLISKIAPLQFKAADQPQQRDRLILQAPFSGLLQSRAMSISELLFVLFILSSTAFDGIHQTDFWMRLYWQDIAAWLQPWTGSNIVQAYPLLRSFQQGFQSSALLLSPVIYLAFYLICLQCMRWLTGKQHALRELALRFAYSLLPIALVYHITHYYTLILTQGAMILRLASDPFGVGWNLFGTAHWLPQPIIPNMDWVWHTQVGLILFGHVVSVYLAHREALGLFDNRRTAAISQLPMLLLMVAFTCFGLWILAQPITATRVQ